MEPLGWGAGLNDPAKEGGKTVPMGWRSKFVFLLVVYFAGFATAIYCLAPASEEKKSRSRRQKQSAYSGLTSDEFAKSVNSGMHKCIDLGKEAAARAAKLIKEKIDEAHSKSDG